LIYVDQTLFDVALSDAGFINYPKVSKNLIFMDTRGVFQYIVESHGYPLLRGDRLYTVNTDLSGLKRLDPESDVLWSIDFVTPITSLSVSEQRCFIGLLDGTARLIDEQGNLVLDHKSAGSRIPVILGTAVQGNRLALISGIDPQKLTILFERAEELIPVAAFDLDSDYRREVFIRFSDDGNFLYYEEPEGLGVFDLDRKNLSHLPLGGNFVALAATGTYAAIVAKDGEKNELLVLRTPRRVLYDGPLPAGQIFLRFIEPHLIVGVGDVLLRFDLQEES
jgi:hypothetical protein